MGGTSRASRSKQRLGDPTKVQHTVHGGRLGIISGHRATAEDVEDVMSKKNGGRRKQYDDFECVHAVMHRPGESQTFYVDLIAGKLECGKTEVTERGSEAGKNDKAR